MTSTDRAAQIEHWVELHALSIVADGGWADPDAWQGVLQTVEPQLTKFSIGGVSGLFNELWPTEDDMESPELEAAYDRSMLLAIRLLERLQELHTRNVTHLAGVVGEKIRVREVVPNA